MTGGQTCALPISFEQAFGVIVVALIIIFGISGMTVIGVLGKIIEWFA